MDPDIMFDEEYIPELRNSVKLGQVEMAKKQKHLDDIQRVVT